MARRKHPSGFARGAVPGRARQGNAVWLYGDHAVSAALTNPQRTLRRLVVTGAVPESMPPGFAVERVDRARLDALLPRGAVHQGIALLADPLPAAGIEVLADAAEPAVAVMLDQVTDPQNVGAILRSAAAFGAAVVIVQDRHAPEETGALAKAASGALETVPLVRVPNLSRALEDLKDLGYWAVGLDQDATAPLSEAGRQRRVVLVLGAEGSGLRRLVREHCDVLAAIPMAGAARRGAVSSLNVSNAAAIALYVLTLHG
jgi:23S rRNA (guanosine2251-2'-O)-methyltransferase